MKKKIAVKTNDIQMKEMIGDYTYKIFRITNCPGFYIQSKK